MTTRVYNCLKFAIFIERRGLNIRERVLANINTVDIEINTCCSVDFYVHIVRFSNICSFRDLLWVLEHILLQTRWQGLPYSLWNYFYYYYTKLCQKIFLLAKGSFSRKETYTYKKNLYYTHKSKKTSAFPDRPTASTESNQEDKYSKGNEDVRWSPEVRVFRVYSYLEPVDNIRVNNHPYTNTEDGGSRQL